MRQPDNLLDPRHFSRVRRPALDAETLPPWCYTSKDWFDLEIERIFKRSWGYVGRVDRVPNAGDYVAFDYAGTPVIIVRARDGKVRAFANSCRHRGSEILRAGSGTCKAALKCPYHGWAYGLDGKLIGAAGMEETKDFDKARHGLIPIRLETWAGFMFINPGETGPSLLEWLDDLPELTASYGFEDWACTRRREYELACNWKIIIENFNDEAHIRTVHPKTLLDISEKYAAPAVYEHGDGYWVGSYCEHEGTRLMVGGVDGPAGFDPVPTLKGRLKHGSYHPTVYPHVSFGFCIDGGWALEVYPLAPDRSKLVVNSFFHKDALKRADFASVVQRYYDRLDVSTDEDNAIEEAVQRGLVSPQAKPGRLSQEEIGINWLHNWWLDQIFGVTTESHKPDKVRADARAA